jgi:DMSO reductase anchor subunit
VLHLGRPRFAFRAVLGLRHSWLSREIVAFGLFAKLAALYAGVVLVGRLSRSLDPATVELTAETLGWAVVASGIIALFCSAMIYVFTQRECWSFTRVIVRFTLTAALLGVGVVWFSALALMLFAPSPELAELLELHGPWLCRALVAVAAARLMWDAAIFRHLLVRRTTPLKRSAQLMTRQLSSVTLARFAAGLLGGIVMPGLLLGYLSTSAGGNHPQFAIATATLCLACLAGELLERFLFFAACATPRMPGTIY